MLFNSLEFLIFLPSVFMLYWFVLGKRIKHQNSLIVLSSYLFYGWWDWRFLFLIMFSTIVDYTLGIKLSTTNNLKQRKLLLWASICINIGLLGFFKYYNFFLDSFIEVFKISEGDSYLHTIEIILPVGISFYTFQTLSYTIDIYQRKLKPTNDFVAFAAFVSFFPQLVAGPIERASHLLPQFYKKRLFNYNQAKTGIQLIIWGFFKKIVIADNASIIVDGIFSSYESQSSISLIIGAILFSFQIYCDFSGYSDIAIGVARLFNFDLMTNFKYPYLSKNISEFWKNWHISLSTWFRDYIYIPLGGSRVSITKALRNICIVFIISGFWHGANWTFIFWGGLHAILYIPVFLNNHKNQKSNSTISILKTIFTFILVSLAWVFFRADSIGDAFEYLELIFTNNGGKHYFLSTKKHILITSLSFIFILLLTSIEYYFKRKNQFEITLNRYGLMAIILITIFFGAFKNHSNFIYFQF